VKLKTYYADQLLFLPIKENKIQI